MRSFTTKPSHEPGGHGRRGEDGEEFAEQAVCSWPSLGFGDRLVKLREAFETRFAESVPHLRRVIAG